MKRVHYGWFVCFGCALLLFCTSGLCVNAFTIYQPYILSQNHFTNAQSSSIITVRSAFAFLSMFLSGTYYKRFSLRNGMTIAGMLTALAFCLFGVAKTYWMYCVAAAMMGLAYGLGTMIPIAIMLEHWFVKKRTLAISLCSAVTGVSTLGFPSLLTWLIETYSLQTTFFAEGCFVAVLSAITWLLVRDYPSQKNMTAYGAGAVVETAKAAQHSRKLERSAWLLLVPMLLLIGAMTNVGYSHLTVLATSQGFSSHITALAITVSGVMMTLGKCVFGWVSEKVGMYTANWIFGGILTIGMVLCCVTGSNTVILFASMCAYGTGLALTTIGLTAWAGELSSPAQYDSTVRRFQIGYAAGSMLFSTLPGILADVFDGSYVPAYIFFTVCTLYVIFAIQWSMRKAVRAKKIQSLE